MEIFIHEWMIWCEYSVILHENVDISFLITTQHKVTGMNVNVQVYKLQKGYTLHKGDLHKPLKNWNTGLVGASQLEDI